MSARNRQMLCSRPRFFMLCFEASNPLKVWHLHVQSCYVSEEASEPGTGGCSAAGAGS